MGLKADVYFYVPTVISDRLKNPAWEVRDGAVCFANDVEGSKRKGGSCVLKRIENQVNMETHGLNVMT